MKLLAAVSVFLALVVLLQGARYNGHGPDWAAKYLDRSQGKIPHGHWLPAHPRGHAIGIDSGRENIDSLQDFSLITWQMGFASRRHQNVVVHKALKHTSCDRAFQRLNSGRDRETCYVSAKDIREDGLIAQIWFKGEPTHCFYMRQVVLELGHFEGEEDNPDADVLIFAAYPEY